MSESWFMYLLGLGTGLFCGFIWAWCIFDKSDVLDKENKND